MLKFSAMEKDIKAGLVCLFIVLFAIVMILFAINKTPDGQEKKTTRTKDTSLASQTTTTQSSLCTTRNQIDERKFKEQGDSLRKCLNELFNLSQNVTITEHKTNGKLPDFRCQSNIDCVGLKGYSKCFNGFCSCEQKISNPNQNWKYLKAYGECVICPEGWETDDLIYSEHFLKYFHEGKTFFDALNTCKSFDAELITVDTIYEWQAYQRYVGLYKLENESIWLGYHSAHNPLSWIEFLNVHTKEHLEGTDFKWCYDGPYRTQPKGVNELCVESGKNECDRFIASADCQKKNAFICIKHLNRCKSNENWYIDKCCKTLYKHRYLFFS